ncbi:hypothetical protein CGCF415_v006540 [Colletotrichum fructicola]|uniref:uncharacterized protein n=1 Tax=Colletotrichum siamense TaxID=690259 RepID=UPI0018731071|nr:uncharacterized protein CGCS363_v003598 [Colletotrichum siamense]KAF4883689.1 hypothetical protein CGCFRS4_v013366 [Colletotrichum fructicola]KAF4908491.1 hypothetical protein CGCF415_v006540 [Colletotrichum fructicola]KAF4938822.1 hypothetical protein CGCF245_v004185 [Colletotrichum fructicola]KAF5511606.1 hypothetical protein CGCS363_v003598 [Colletotrichum siamense]
MRTFAPRPRQEEERSLQRIWGKVKRSAAGLPLLMMASLDQSGARAKDAKVTSGRERAHTTPELCNRRGKRHTRTGTSNTSTTTSTTNHRSRLTSQADK